MCFEEKGNESSLQGSQLESLKAFYEPVRLTEVWHMAHFWVSYGRCTMPGSPMGRSEGLSRRWAG